MLLVIFSLISLATAVPPVWWNSTEPCGVSPYPDAGESCLFESGPCTNIVGGIGARENEFPYMVSLIRNEDGVWNHFCGGVLINEYWVLTLGLCSLGTQDPDVNMRAVLGAHLRSSPSPNQVTINVAGTVTHESYVPEAGDDNDIGLVKLAEPAPISDFIKPVCPPDPVNEYTAASCVVSGWGSNVNNGPFEDQLTYTNISVNSQSFCVSEIIGYTPEGRLCASNADYTRDTCDGDVGGPLADKINGQFTVIGLVGASLRCGEGKPGIYTRVGDFSDWITAKMEKN